MFLLIFLPLIIYLIVSYIVASKFETIAIQKGYDSSIHSFAMCFWLGIIGYLYVIALPDLHARQTGNNQNIDNSKEEQKSQEEIYDSLVKLAEKYKDPFYGREARIYTYKSVIKDMEVLANENYGDSASKLQEYKSYLDLLISNEIK